MLVTLYQHIDNGFSKSERATLFMLFLDCIWKYDQHETESTQKADMRREEEEKDRKRKEQEWKKRVARDRG